MIATQASPGQGTLQVAAEKAPHGLLAVIVVRDRKGGASVRYTIKDEWLPTILDWLKSKDPMGRYQAVDGGRGVVRGRAGPVVRAESAKGRLFDEPGANVPTRYPPRRSGFGGRPHLNWSNLRDRGRSH